MPPKKRGARGFLIQETYEALREEILSHRIGPGVKLTAEHLAVTLNVSRTPVRQALERLFQEGYVVKIPARGFFVAEMKASEVEDLYDIRCALETHALNKSLTKGISAQDLRKLTALNNRYAELTTDERSEADHQFHLALASLSGNQAIEKMLQDIHDRLNFRRRYDGYWYWSAKGPRGIEAAAQHQKVLEAIAKGKKSEAVQQLRKHIESAWENYRTFLEESARVGIGKLASARRQR